MPRARITWTLHVKLHVREQLFSNLIGWKHSLQPIRSHVRKLPSIRSNCLFLHADITAYANRAMKPSPINTLYCRSSFPSLCFYLTMRYICISGTSVFWWVINSIRIYRFGWYTALCHMHAYLFRIIENTLYLTNIQYWIITVVLYIPHLYILCSLVRGCTHIPTGTRDVVKQKYDK